MTDNSHGMSAAAATLDSICELFQAYNDLEDGEETTEADGCDFQDQDDISDHVQEMALEVSVRNSDWYTPGGEDEGPTEYRILLTWGGPAVQVTGKLNKWSEPETWTIQGQDWFTAWESLDTDDDQDAALEWFSRQFYFGG